MFTDRIFAPGKGQCAFSGKSLFCLHVKTYAAPVHGTDRTARLAPQMGVYPRAQFRDTEGLLNIIIGARPKPCTRAASSALAVKNRMGQSTSSRYGRKGKSHPRRASSHQATVNHTPDTARPVPPPHPAQYPPMPVLLQAARTRASISRSSSTTNTLNIKSSL